jgi:hypothetical protein
MAILTTDIKYRLSVVTASAGDAVAGTPAGALGDQFSTTIITPASLHNLFDVVTGAEAAAGVVDYRCFFVHNDHATLTLVAATAKLTSQTALGGTIAFGLDPTAISAKNSASAQAVTIASETVAPAGVTFNTTDQLIGDMAPGTVKAIWLRRTVTAATAAINPDGVLMTVQGDTDA